MNSLNLCKLPILLSTGKLKLGHEFPQFIHRFKIRIFEFWSYAVFPSFFQLTKRFWDFGILVWLDFSISLSSWKMWKIEAFQYKPRLYFQIFPNSLKSWEIFYSGLFIPVWCNTSWAMHLRYAWIGWQEKKKFSTIIKINLTKIHFHNLTIKVTHQQIRICLKSFFITLKTLNFTCI